MREMGGKGLMTADVNHNADSTSDKVIEAGEAESEAVWPDSDPADSDVVRLTAAWPALSKDVKARITAILDAATRRAS
jgi:hypothetical protein